MNISYLNANCARAALLLIVIALNGCAEHSARTHENVTINGETFRLELAVDNDARALGLGGRTSIEPDGGMLFVFPDADERSFWMKNCLTPMDIMFLGPTGRITAMYEMPVEPPRRSDESDVAYELRLKSYRSNGRAQYAIELAPGSITRLGVQVDDRIILNFADLKTFAH
ncbi:MAG: DUF192 domain-containing protein [Phycisphaerales bacterium]|nr:DUF192 domain-containing protein [Phycisphaerales bacterium]